MTAVDVAHVASVLFCLATADIAEESVRPEDALRQWAGTFQSSDIVKMVAFYEDSQQVVAIESTGKMHRGAAAIRKMYAEAFEEVEFERVSLEILSARQNENIAWATCRLKADTVVRTDKSRWSLQIQGSFVLKRDKGIWKIALEHFSPIPGVPRVQPR